MSDARRRPRRALLEVAVASLALAVLPSCLADTTKGARPTPPLTWGEPFGPRLAVVIDPGHGGDDTGTRAASGLLEKDLTLDVARRLRALLLAMDGIDVSLTRERDVWLPREERVAAVRAADADLLLSLHFNVLPERDIALVETFYAHASNIVDSRTQRRSDAGSHAASVDVAADEPHDVSFTRGSERFAALLQRHVFETVAKGNDRAVDAGTKRDTLFVLTRGFTSGALIELTCLSNPAEAGRLADERYRDELAAALARAIGEYREHSNVIAPVVSADSEM